MTDRILQAVRQLSAELTPERDVNALGQHAHLERDFGLGSLERVQLVQRLEAELGQRVNEQAVFQAATVADLVAALEGRPPESQPVVQLVAVPPLPEKAETLIEVLAYQAAHDRLFLYLEGLPPVSYGDLWREAERYAAGLVELGVEPGDRVGSMLPTGLPFLALHFGILRLGAIPVPLYPPFRLDQLEEYLRRQHAILENARVKVLVTVEAARAVADLMKGSWRVAAVESLPLEAVAPCQPGGVALIQYTSGSTGQPKGVVLSHASLLANLRSYGRGMAIGPEDITVSWLPLYHDMGLIGSLLGSLYHGIPLVLMGPQDFLARPARWLQAISRHRATISPAPNFAYEICARRIPDAELEGLDLSSWRIALNGAEAVRPETMERFCRRYEPCGFRPGAVFPAYGLAEASLGVTFPPPGRGMKTDLFEGRSVVSCGSALPDMEVRIRGASGERQEGPIEFRGPSSLSEYYRRPEPVKDAEGWVDTGDQGYLFEGELYVTGRLKDLILKAGRNLHPEDVEDLAAEVEGVRRGCVAAFGVSSGESGTEELWVLCETRSPSPELEQAVRTRILEGLGLAPDRVLLAPPGAVLKTPSGKIRRSECKKRAQEGKLGPGRPGLRLVLAELRRRLSRGLQQTARGAYGGWCWLLAGGSWLTLLAAGPHKARRLTRPLCRALLRLTGLSLKVNGEPPRRPCVLVANHSSLLDSLALMAACPLPLRFVVASWVARLPLVRPVLGNLGLIAVVRGRADAAAEQARAQASILRAGESVAGYPEGGLEISIGLRPFMLGLFLAAAEAGVPVCVVALRGTRRALPWPRLIPRPGRLEVEFLGLLEPEGPGFEAVLALAHEARKRIAERCGEPLVSQRLARED